MDNASIRRALLDTAPGVRADSAPGLEGAPHLVERRRPIGKELQTLLADSDVDPTIGHLQCVGRALDVGDRCRAVEARFRRRHRQHRRAEVAGGDAARLAGARGG
jgi:hypothetical protein